jgi:hypothetical protein
MHTWWTGSPAGEQPGGQFEDPPPQSSIGAGRNAQNSSSPQAPLALEVVPGATASTLMKTFRVPRVAFAGVKNFMSPGNPALCIPT